MFHPKGEQRSNAQSESNYDAFGKQKGKLLTLTVISLSYSFFLPFALLIETMRLGIRFISAGLL